MAWHISDANSFDPKIYVILFALFHFSFTGVEGLGSSLFLPKGNKKEKYIFRTFRDVVWI